MAAFKKLYLLYVTAILVCVSILTSYQLPDDAVLRAMVAKFAKYTERYQTHKIYLHIDKAYYTTGETIWFKAYQVNGNTHEPIGTSRVLYVELIDTNQHILLKEKLRLEGGFAKGDFLLADSLPTGLYTVRAYNNWMRNFDPAFFFHQQVQIFNTSQPAQTAMETVIDSRQTEIQFFPESGNLVNGLMSKVAFKATNTAGEATAIAGVIADVTGDTITTFKSLHLGMGAFNLQPIAGKVYVAKVRLADSTLAQYVLPQALNSGFVMAVDNTSGEVIKVQLTSSNSVEAEAMYLIAQVRGQIYFSAQVNLQSGTAVNIPKKDFPDGIVQLTLFNSKGEPQCERLIFVNHENNLQIRLQADKSSYAPREKVTMQIAVNDAKGNPVSAHLSMAVAEVLPASVSDQYSGNILTYLLLTSDLKGTIENPEFYFSKNNPEAKQALDHLMLTQGWRRFVWKEILGTNYRQLPYDAEDGITLAGKLMQTDGKNPEANQFIALSIPGGVPAFQHQYTDEAGNFYFPGLQYTGSKELLLHIPAVGAQPARSIALDTLVPLTDAVSSIHAQPDVRKFAPYLEKSRMRKEIAKVYNHAFSRDNSAVNETLVLQEGQTKKAYPITDVPADHSIDLDKYNEFPDMTEVLREIVPGILTKNKKGVNTLRVLNIKTKLYFKGEPVYFIDGIPVYHADYIFKLDPGMVETIEVYGRPDKLASFDLLGRNGVVAVFTRTGDLYPENAQSSIKIPFTGYYQAREFYTPTYENVSPSSRKPDFRPLLYWNPEISTDASGKATVTFFTADNLASFKATVEGISAKGNPVVAEGRFEVKLPLQSKK